MLTRHEQLKKNEQELDAAHDQRRAWLWASSVVFFAIITLMFAWEWIDHFESKTAWWFIVSCMLLISINWWYWTMRVMRLLLSHEATNYRVLVSMLDDLAAIKDDVQALKDSHATK